MTFPAHVDDRPKPDWLITEDGAIDTELARLQTGKEADAFLLERTLGERSHLLVAKRYRDHHHRAFRNDAAYRAGRRTGNRRDDLAIAGGSRAGMRLRGEQWARHEFHILQRLWAAWAPVPYPISCTGAELLMEYVGDIEQPAPRLIDIARIDQLNFVDLWQQCLQALRTMVTCDVVHADLSAYNILVWQGRLVLIDFPQAAEIGLSEHDMEFLHRDVTNVVTFFERVGVGCDIEDVYADVVSHICWL
jgi:RIO kinase 1